MSNFIGLVYATLKANNIDYSDMSTDEAIATFERLRNESKSVGMSKNKEDMNNLNKLSEKEITAGVQAGIRYKREQKKAKDKVSVEVLKDKIGEAVHKTGHQGKILPDDMERMLKEVGNYSEQ